MAVTRDTMISNAGEEVIGNDANRFDVPTQTSTYGPEPPTASDGPPETRGTFAPSPKAN